MQMMLINAIQESHNLTLLLETQVENLQKELQLGTIELHSISGRLSAEETKVEELQAQVNKLQEEIKKSKDKK